MLTSTRHSALDKSPPNGIRDQKRWGRFLFVLVCFVGYTVALSSCLDSPLQSVRQTWGQALVQPGREVVAGWEEGGRGEGLS